MINKAIIKVNSKKDIEIVNEMINETFQQKKELIHYAYTLRIRNYCQ